MRMRAFLLAGVMLMAGLSLAHAQVQSKVPADKALAKKILNAIVKAGVDLRTASVQVVVTADHTVYLKGLISDSNEAQLAVKTAQENAPGYKVVNKINGGFFDDPNHVNGGMTK
jgi:methionine-rich copper-binding protein CopC